MKRFLSVCMAACILTSAAAVPSAGIPVCAEEEGEVLHLIRYSIENGEVTVTGSDADSGELVIPAEIEGCPVTAIESSAFSTTRFSKITLPDTLKTIGGDAFFSCTKLESLVIPSGVTEIGFNAFARCKSLKTVVFSDGVTATGESAFTGCTALESVTLPETLTAIEPLAFSDCKNLKEINIPAGVKRIGRNAFTGTAWLTAQRAENPLVTANGILIDAQTAEGNVVLPESVTSFSPAAFFQAYGVKTVVIPEGVTVLPEDLFLDCANLTEAVIPDSVTEIADGAFYGCCALRTAALPSGITRIGAAAFLKCEKLASVFIPSGVTAIGDGTFLSCKMLEIVSVPDTVQFIGKKAFSECDSLRTLILPDSVTFIAADAFLDSRDITLSGSKGSYAESYANANNIPFTASDSSTAEPVTLMIIDGDLNQNFIIDLEDIKLLNAHISQGTPFSELEDVNLALMPRADLNHDGNIDAADCRLLKELFFPTVSQPGNVTLDKLVNLDDIRALNAHLETGEPFFADDADLDAQAMKNADVNGDGTIDAEDLSAVKTAFYEKISDPGDVDLNGRIDREDIKKMTSYVTNGTPFSSDRDLNEQAEANADYNKDGKADQSDLDAMKAVYYRSVSIPGDVNFNGFADDFDVTYIELYLAEGRAFYDDPILDAQARLNADYNNDGTIDEQDTKLITKAYLDSALDINGDGSLTVSDAVLLARVVAEDANVSITPEGLEKADLDNDGYLTVNDTVILLKLLVSL